MLHLSDIYICEYFWHNHTTKFQMVLQPYMAAICLGHLGWQDTNRNSHICVSFFKMVKASKGGKTTAIFCSDYAKKLCQCKCRLKIPPGNITALMGSPLIHGIS
jgi:hypothetical protein